MMVIKTDKKVAWFSTIRKSQGITCHRKNHKNVKKKKMMQKFQQITL